MLEGLEEDMKDPVGLMIGRSCGGEERNGTDDEEALDAVDRGVRPGIMLGGGGRRGEVRSELIEERVGSGMEY